jgi:Na+-driven multidrug efflux pump
VVVVFARPLLSLYVPGAEEAITVGTMALFFTGIRVLINGVTVVSSAMLSAYGKSLVQMIITLVNIGVNLLWLLVVYPIFPSIGTYLFTTVAVGVVYLVIVLLVERHFTKQYKKGNEFAL